MNHECIVTSVHSFYVTKVRSRLSKNNEKPHKRNKVVQRHFPKDLHIESRRKDALAICRFRLVVLR